MQGTLLGAYRLLEELGSGGMGTVWRARVEGRTAHLEPGAVVAVKVVHPRLLETPGSFRRFLREAEVGRSLRHDNLLRTFECDAIAVGGVPQHFLVMEYVAGRSLRSLLAETGRLPEALCRHVGRDVARGLAAIHAAGVVHRDLKPENVLVTPDHEVKVMDLGLARLVDEAVRLSSEGAFVGTVRYAAPEQFGGGARIDARTDLWSLGVLLYELASGVHPFEDADFRGTVRRILHERPRRLGEVQPQVSPFFEEAVHALLAKDPADRPATASDVAALLDAGEEGPWWSAQATAIRETTRRPLRRVRIPRETALHGRDAELARLRDLWTRAREGDGRVLLVEGEAGIGKSRLVDEFVGALAREGEDLNFLHGSYPPGGAATASGAFTTAYREQFGDAGSSRWLREASALVPAFDALLRGEGTPAGAEPLTKDSLQTCFVHATRALAADRPTVVLVDDLHFAPDEGLALFAALAHAVPGHRALLVGTTRPGLDPAWVSSLVRLPHAEHLPLPRLGPRDLARLLADALRSEPLAESLGVRIALKSDGNPYFVFEILRELREGRLLERRDDGSWATTAEIRELRIPSTIQDLVRARVAALPAEDRHVLEVASCLGFEFDPGLLAEAVATPRVPLFQRLGAIEASHRLVRASGRRFVFDHHQVQEALYEGIFEPLREEYHAAIGRALEARDGAGSKDPKALDGALAAELCDHFLRGGDGARGLRYLDAALAHLEKGWAHAAAVALAQRALAAPGLLGGAERGRLLVRILPRLGALGRRAEQRAAVDEAWALAEATGDVGLSVRAGGAKGRLLLDDGSLGEAERQFRKAIDLARASEDLSGERVARTELGALLLRVRRLDDAFAEYERALAVAREERFDRAEASVLGNLATVMRYRGRIDESIALYRRSIEMARAGGHRDLEAATSGSLGGLLGSLGRFAEAKAHYERHRELARSIGDRVSEGWSLGYGAHLLTSLGRYEESLRAWDRYLEFVRELGLHHNEAWAVENRGWVLGLLGRADEAREQFRRAASIHVEDPARASGCFLSLAELEIGAGRFAAAEEALDRCAALVAGRDDGRNATLLAALRARLPGADLDACEADYLAGEPVLAHADRLDGRIHLHRATGRRAHLVEAKRLLEAFVEHAPEEDRPHLVERVRAYREIAAAAAAAGI